MADTTAPSGPFESTRTTTFEIAGPIKITVSSVEKATHAPKPCGCGGGGNGGQLLEQLMAVIAQKMGQAPDDDAPPSPSSAH